VLVPGSAVEAARGTLQEAELVDPGAPAVVRPSGRQALVMLLAIVLGAGLAGLIAWALLEAAT
jgi:hypothetical protein